MIRRHIQWHINTAKRMYANKRMLMRVHTHNYRMHRHTHACTHVHVHTHHRYTQGAHTHTTQHTLIYDTLPQRFYCIISKYKSKTLWPRKQQNFENYKVVFTHFLWIWCSRFEGKFLHYLLYRMLFLFAVQIRIFYTWCLPVISMEIRDWCKFVVEYSGWVPSSHITYGSHGWVPSSHITYGSHFHTKLGTCSSPGCCGCVHVSTCGLCVYMCVWCNVCVCEWCNMCVCMLCVFMCAWCDKCVWDVMRVWCMCACDVTCVYLSVCDVISVYEWCNMCVCVCDVMYLCMMWYVWVM